MKVTDFTYDLPEERIAKYPPHERGTSRLLVLHRKNGDTEHRKYIDFIDYLKPGDIVVLNDTKVIKARLRATNRSGQKRELLLLEDHHNSDPHRRHCIYRGSLKTGETLEVDGKAITITNIKEGGIAEIATEVNVLELAEQEGTVPLPPYIHREASEQDIKRYQTVFAHNIGSVAAPTASLNITQRVLDNIVAKGATVSYLTLHIGLGTFLPIRTDNVEQHNMHSEYFEIPKETVEAIQNAKRVVAIGTTVARTLEYSADKIKMPAQKITGEANIFIYPGYQFKVVEALLTNFHAPRTTVLMLAAAFAGWENLKHAYDEALKENYSFLSYGDSMLII
jgi:S-adenosylmethionine:tRNA ribosyltransferase-isomerase